MLQQIQLQVNKHLFKRILKHYLKILILDDVLYSVPNNKIEALIEQLNQELFENSHTVAIDFLHRLPNLETRARHFCLYDQRKN